MILDILKRHYGKLWTAYALVLALAWLRPLHGFLRTVLAAGFLAFSLAWLVLPIHESKAGGEPTHSSPTTTFLCDTCKYDYGHVCTRPERPNATQCEDYRAA